MAMVTTVHPGDPTVEVTGEHRGTLYFTFDDGEVLSSSLQAPDLATWNAEIPRLEESALDRKRAIDSEAVVEDPPNDAGNGEASTLDTMVFKLRYAYSRPYPRSCYTNMKQIDDYRISKGWTWGDVHDAIFAEPKYNFTEGEWTNIQDRYTYLNTPANITAMDNFHPVLQGDTWGDEFRSDW